MNKDIVSEPEGGSCTTDRLCEIDSPTERQSPLRLLLPTGQTIMALNLDNDWDANAGMDMDTDTTFSLNQTDKAKSALPSSPREDFAFADLDDAQELPLQKLIRYWMNERHAPDILPIQAELLAGILDHIHKQVRRPSIARAWRIEGADLFSYKRTVIHRQSSAVGSSCFRG